MATVYLIPSLLAEDGVDAVSTLTAATVRDCKFIFAENIRTARRFLKAVDRTIVIDDFEWFEMEKNGNAHVKDFADKLKAGGNIAIISEAGCPGIADPGAELVAMAHEKNAHVKPLVGPNSMILALMASGLNGQQFEFVGYLPIDAAAREKRLRELEASSRRDSSTKIFIETPYRNRAMLDSILKACANDTKLCIAKDLTSKVEYIRTATIADWKKDPPSLGKEPCVFLLGS